MNEPLTWAETRRRLRIDRARLAAVMGAGRPDAVHGLWHHPSFVCVFLYRLSNHCFRRRWVLAARALWHVNMILTGADLAYGADIGEGLVVLRPAGTAVAAKVGRNLTLCPGAGIGAETGRWEDIGAGPSLPVLGDDVWMEHLSGILGPVRIGHRARIGPGFAATCDVPDDSEILGATARLMRRPGGSPDRQPAELIEPANGSRP